ncbi:hypothetical protein L228DRAFT_263786 [Xylona heveae TC161]|uniref:Uncharacterized protein n=1 Tax=Xylona heveae (strain CBS 132557 / TC161) TaxID=1328760 RepID=A0A164ZSZ0_XYLHT|nr:hypothetical protein L228DRAFT_263786 [Xylona heveae TC161]KZF19471.1 hypothetical protein L228DRAFT_263786 [Xylona heveae TC161]
MELMQSGWIPEAGLIKFRTVAFDICVWRLAAGVLAWTLVSWRSGFVLFCSLGFELWALGCQVVAAYGTLATGWLTGSEGPDGCRSTRTRWQWLWRNSFSYPENPTGGPEISSGSWKF